MNVVRFRRLALGVLLYTVLVVLWGALVRATGSGAGCGSHWPECNGVIVPRAPTLETIIEYTHRLTSGLALIAVVWLYVAARRTFPQGHLARRGALLSLIFMLTEAAVGAGLVLLEYVADDARSGRAVWMGVHLVNTFLLLAALTDTWVRAKYAEPLRWKGQGVVGGTILASFGGMLVLGVTGAISALGNTLFPVQSLAEGIEQHFSPTSHLLLQLGVLHPFVALFVGVWITATAVLVARLRPDPRVRWWSGALRVLFGAQLALGVLTLVLHAPVWMQIVHLLFADLVWMALVVLTTAALAEGTQRVDEPGVALA